MNISNSVACCYKFQLTINLLHVSIAMKGIICLCLRFVLSIRHNGSIFWVNVYRRIDSYLFRLFDSNIEIRPINPTEPDTMVQNQVFGFFRSSEHYAQTELWTYESCYIQFESNTFCPRIFNYENIVPFSSISL